MDEVKKDNQQGEQQLDLGAEFRNTFDMGGIQERYLTMAAQHLLNTNPTKAYVESFAGAPDNVKQQANDRLAKAANVWLDMWEGYLTSGKSIPADLIAYVATLARQNKEKLERTER